RLLQEGNQKPPFVKGAACSAGGFRNVAVMKRTFTSSLAMLAPWGSQPCCEPRGGEARLRQTKREPGSRTPKESSHRKRRGPCHSQRLDPPWTLACGPPGRHRSLRRSTRRAYCRP